MNEIEYLHVVVMAFMNEDRKVELGVWAYRDMEAAQQRFNRVMSMHKKYEEMGMKSPLVSTETFLIGVYDSFEQSLFVETAPEEIKEN